VHVTLTDVLACPRCGPAFGLVLMPDLVLDRRVLSGVLGCPNCRERYPIDDAVADLAGPAASGSHGPTASAEPGGAPAAESGGRAALRVAALLGLADTRGVVLVMGEAVAWAPELAELVPDVEVVVGAERVLAPGLSSIRLGGTLPFRTGSLAGVALTTGAEYRMREGVRVLAPGARMLLDPAPDGAPASLEEAGARVLAAEGRTVVASR